MWLAHWDVEEPDMDCMMWQFGAYRIGDHELMEIYIMQIIHRHIKMLI